MNKLKMIFCMILGLGFNNGTFAAKLDPEVVKTFQTGESVLKDMVRLSQFLEGREILITSQKEFVALLVAAKDDQVLSLGLIQWFATSAINTKSAINKKKYDRELTESEKLIIRIVILVNQLHELEFDKELNIPAVLEKTLRIFENGFPRESFEKEVEFLKTFEEEFKLIQIKIKIKKINLTDEQNLFCSKYLTLLKEGAQEFECIKSLDKIIADAKKIPEELLKFKKFGNKIELKSQEILVGNAKKKPQVIKEISINTTRLGDQLNNELKDKSVAMINALELFLAIITDLEKKDIRLTGVSGYPLPARIVDLSSKIKKLICDYEQDKNYLRRFIPENQQKINNILEICVAALTLQEKQTQAPIENRSVAISPAHSDQSVDSGLVTDRESEDGITEASQALGNLQISSCAKIAAIQGYDDESEIRGIQVEVVRRFTEKMRVCIASLYDKSEGWQRELDKVNVVFDIIFFSHDNRTWFYRGLGGRDLVSIAWLYENRSNADCNNQYKDALVVATDAVKKVEKVLKEFNEIVDASLAISGQKRNFIAQHALENVPNLSSLDSSCMISDELKRLKEKIETDLAKCAIVLSILVGKPLKVTPKVVAVCENSDEELCMPDFEEEDWLEDSSTNTGIASQWSPTWPVERGMSDVSISVDQDVSNCDYQELIEEEVDVALGKFPAARREFINELQRQERIVNAEFSINGVNRLEFKYERSFKNQKKARGEKQKRLSDSEVMAIGKQHAAEYMKNLQNALLALVQDLDELKAQCENLARALLKNDSQASRGHYFASRACDIQKALDEFYVSSDYTVYKSLKKRMGIVCTHTGCELISIKIPGQSIERCDVASDDDCE